MEEKLSLHDGDRGERGWVDDDPWALIGRVRQELGELECALAVDDLRGMSADEKRGLLYEAADVANMAMMVVDACGALLDEACDE